MAKIKSFQISDALTRSLEETVSAAQNYSGQLRVEVLPIKKIHLDSTNPRELTLEFSDLFNGLNKDDSSYEKKRKEIDSLTSMAESIKREGVINPVVVYKDGEKYRLIAGERRTLASILANKEDVPAKILDKKPSELKLSMLQWIENVERSDLTLWERLRNLEKIAGSYESETGKKITPTTLSELLGCVLSHAMKYHSVFNADETIKNAVKEGKVKNLDKIALVANIEDKNLRQTTLNACIGGATLQKLKNIISADKKHLKQGLQNSRDEGRGRQATRVNLGSTKNTKVVRFILDTIATKKECSTLKEQINKLNWNDYRMVSIAFQNILKTLETQF